ncbi:MAG: aldolase/citrate lyase family protein [Pseudomonadota bacterium]
MIRFGLAARLGAGETVALGWASSGSAVAAEAMASAGFAAVCLDQQHGFWSYSDLLAGVRALQGMSVAPVIRVPHGALSDVGRMLDLGVEAVIAPMINSVDDARDLVAVGKYAPIGGRSWGPTRTKLLADLDDRALLSGSNTNQLLFAMVETRQALDTLDAIAAVDGIDGVFVGPFDLAVSLTDGVSLTLSPDDFRATLGRVAETVAGAGKIPGIFGGSVERARLCRDLGFRFIACGTDIGLLRDGAQAALAAFHEKT